MDTLKDEKLYTYYMVNGGLVQIRINMDMNIQTKIKKKASTVQLKNVVSERECINVDYQALITEINNSLKSEDLELEHYFVEK